MINNDRIIPITKTDFLTLIATLANVFEEPFTILKGTSDGVFAVTEAPETQALCNQPVKRIDIASDVSTVTIGFVPAYDFEGIYYNGVALTLPVEVQKDGISLYGIGLVSGEIAKFGPLTPMDE